LTPRNSTTLSRSFRAPRAARAPRTQRSCSPGRARPRRARSRLIGPLLLGELLTQHTKTLPPAWGRGDCQSLTWPRERSAGKRPPTPNKTHAMQPLFLQSLGIGIRQCARALAGLIVGRRDGARIQRNDPSPRMRLPDISAFAAVFPGPGLTCPWRSRDARLAHTYRPRRERQMAPTFSSIWIFQGRREVPYLPANVRDWPERLRPSVLNSVITTSHDVGGPVHITVLPRALPRNAIYLPLQTSWGGHEIRPHRKLETPERGVGDPGVRSNRGLRKPAIRRSAPVT